MYSLAPIAEEVSSDEGSFADEDEDDSRVSTREDVHAPVSPSMLPPSVPLFTPYPSLAVEKFMTEDDGTPIIDNNHKSESKDGETADDANIPKSAAASSSSNLWLARVSSRIFTDSSSAISSVTSHIARASRSLTADSITEHLTSRDDEKMFQLPDFCKLIEEHASLERARILSVECYREPIQLGVVHRTLIFHLRRERRTDIWMRVDRRRSRKVSFPVFAIRGGRTEANDVALLAGSKESLLDRRPATLENNIEFKSPPNLGVFRFCLHVICEELLEYRLWPNCWFMCSLLQEHLFKAGKGAFQYGGYRYLHLARDIRSRIETRVYHTVQLPSSLFETWSSLQEDKTTSSLIEASQDLTWRYERRGSKRVASAAFMEQLRREVKATGTVASQNDRSIASSEAVSGVDLALHAFRSEDELYQSEIFAKPSRLLSAAQAHRSRATIIHAQLQNFQDVSARAMFPDPHDLVSGLVRAARTTSETYPATSRACMEYAWAILKWSPKIGGLWTSGQVLEGHTHHVHCVAFSPDGKQIASASHDKTVRRWDPLTGESIGEPMRGHMNLVYAVAFSPDGTQTVSGSRYGTLRRWDASSGKLICAPMQGHTDSVLSVAYSPDGKVIVSGSADHTIQRWDASTDERVGKPLEGHGNWVRSVAFSPDGKRIVSGSDDQTIRLWDAITGDAIGEPWKGHTRLVLSVAFSPNGKFVVSGSGDNSVCRWDALTGKSIGGPMKGHTENVNCVAFSPNGNLIASASDDRTIRIWGAATGEQIGEPLKGHTKAVYSVAFSPDRRQIVSGSWDDTVRIWDSLEDLDPWTESE